MCDERLATFSCVVPCPDLLQLKAVKFGGRAAVEGRESEGWIAVDMGTCSLVPRPPSFFRREARRKAEGLGGDVACVTSQGRKG